MKVKKHQNYPAKQRASRENHAIVTSEETADLVSHFLKKSLMENLIFCVVPSNATVSIFDSELLHQKCIQNLVKHLRQSFLRK